MKECYIPFKQTYKNRIAMLPFITKNINDPWGQQELDQWKLNGSQRDPVIYNPQINARFIVEDKNTYSACLKVKGGEYKNFWLVPISRTSFLFIAYVPQLEFLNELAENQIVKQILPKFSFLYSIYTQQNNNEGYKLDDETRIGSGAIILKVEESLDDFIFPWRGCVDNKEIISSYAKLNDIYSKIVSQIEKLLTITNDLNNRAIEAIETKQKQILKKTLIKTGVKLVALCVAPYAAAAIDGIDLLVDGMDIFDVDMSDFSYANFDDNLLDLGEGYNESIANQSNISFGSRYDHINSIYDPEISSAENKLISDLDRIRDDGPYPWENEEQTLERDKQSIEYWNNCKDEAMLKADIDQAKQDKWDSISDYVKERMGKKIHG